MVKRYYCSEMEIMLMDLHVEKMTKITHLRVFLKISYIAKGNGTKRAQSTFQALSY